MKFCRKCGAQLDDEAVICPQCGCSTEIIAKQESSGLGIAAIIFSVLGGFLGLILSIIGLCTYKTPQYRKLCKIGLGIFFAWVVIVMLMVFTTFS